MKTLFNRITHAFAAAGLLALSGQAAADSLAIIHATVHTAGAQGTLNDASVIVEDGKITAINPAEYHTDQVFDAKGADLTPGLIATGNQLGLTEIGAVAASNDDSDEKADVDFMPALAFNPLSTLIPYTRKGGITRAVIVPGPGKDIFGGQSAVVSLTGEFDSVLNESNALVVFLGAERKGSRATALQTLTDKLEDTRKSLKEDSSKKKDDAAKEPSRQEQVLRDVVSGKKPLLAYAERSTDILHLIELKKRFKLKLVIVGADDAVVVKDQLAAAEVPVVINPMDDLPQSFDGLHASLQNAGELSRAGVKVIIHEPDTHNAYMTRFHAGNAVSYGMSKEAALKALTANPAEALNIDAGTIAVGKPADLVLWSGDMFELSSYVVKMWIGGKEYSTESRQDKLRERYMHHGNMPEAYNR